MEGTVELTFRVGTGGAATDLRVERSAGAVLDEAACAAVRAAAPLPLVPGPVRLPIRFRLTD
jgi:TonB family protein